MGAPTVATRLQRRCIVLCTDAALRARLEAALPGGWTLTVPGGDDALDDFAEVLQHRFVLLDLDEAEAFDPIAVIEKLRSEMLLNVPIFCFGGDAARRDAARLARADRFFERAEIAGRLPQFCAQFAW
ncbi:MAG: hypothetical protein R3357_09320 [Burkholderiales bacterium]|nr:hypothetical protein [Burkholderiales bacterium]